MVHRFVVIAGFVGLMSPAMAQEKTKEILSEQVDKAVVKLEGWDRYAGFGLNGTMVSNQNVVGKDEGQTTSLGLKFEGAIDYREGATQWANSLNYIAAGSRTPLLGKYVKSEDNLQAQSLYKYLLNASSGIGTFSRVQLETSLFEGFDNRAQPVTYQLNKLDGTSEQRDGTRLKLTDGLRPLKLSESLGAFVNVFDSQALKLDVKAGLGLRQVFSKKQFVVGDNADTPEIEVNQIDDYKKAGYEIGSDLQGATSDKRITYKLSANVLLPFYESPETGNSDSTFEKRIVDINGLLSFHLVEWASLDYVLKALRDPNLLNKTQVSQSFLVSANYVLANRRKD